MPDGTLIPAHELDVDLSAHGILAMLKDHGAEALQRAIDDVGGDPTKVNVEVLVQRYAWHLHERFAQSATTLRLSIDSAREIGVREGRREVAEAQGAAAMLIEKAKHAFAGPLMSASARERMTSIEAFTASATDQLRKSVGLGVVAVRGQILRGELPRLDARVTAVYFANALGQAAGDALALHLGLANLVDAPLVRAMRESFTDGFQKTFGPLAEACTGKVN